LLPIQISVTLKFMKQLETLKSESVIGIKGIVKRREAANPNLKSGQVEVEVKELEVFPRQMTFRLTHSQIRKLTILYG